MEMRVVLIEKIQLVSLKNSSAYLCIHEHPLTLLDPKAGPSRMAYIAHNHALLYCAGSHTLVPHPCQNSNEKKN